jgi:hypothetical protein
MIRARDGDCVPDLPPGPSGRSRIIRIPGACWWHLWGAHVQTICWPSEPRWGLLPYPAVGWPSGGTEVPRVMHGIPLNDDPDNTFLAPCVHGTADEWWNPALDYPWGPVGSGSDDYNLAVMDIQESRADAYISAAPFLTDAAGYELSGDCWFGLYMNSMLVDSDSATVTTGSLLYHGAITVGDRFHVVYQTEVECPGGGQQGVAWNGWAPL